MNKLAFALAALALPLAACNDKDNDREPRNVVVNNSDTGVPDRGGEHEE